MNTTGCGQGCSVDFFPSVLNDSLDCSLSSRVYVDGTGHASDTD